MSRFLNTIRRNRLVRKGLQATGAIVAVGASTCAQAAADTNVMASVNGAVDTYEGVKPLALAIAGTFLAIAIGFKAWKKLTRS